VAVPVLRMELSLTPKAKRIDELRAQGMSFDEAFAIADSEYTSDGLSLKPGAHAPAMPEVRACQQ
jgi:hypothetical protein